MMTVSNKPFNDAKQSQTLKDVTDDYYKDLRRPRRVTFFKNGDRYFNGKSLMITPNRYISFRELMGDLNRCVDLPYGVRRVFTPVGGHEIRNIDDLVDGASYVCASFEPFRPIKYGEWSEKPWNAHSIHPHRHDINGAYLNTSTLLPPIYGTHNNQGYYLPRQYVRTFPGAKRTGLSNSKQLATSETWSKPRLITVIKAGEKPRKKVSILLNRKAVHSFEQFVYDISDAFGLPQWKNDKIKKLYTLKGRRVQGMSDFFRDDDVFIGVSNKENLNPRMVQDILEELYPDNPYAQNLFKEWEKARRPPVASLDNKSNQRDSGLGDDDSADYLNQDDSKTSRRPQLKDLNESRDSRDSKQALDDKKKKKKKKEKEILLEIETQRQKERLRLMEEERKKREALIQATEREQQSKQGGPTYITVVKHGSIGSDPATDSRNNLNASVNNKSKQRRPKYKVKAPASLSEDEGKAIAATPSGIIPVITEDEKPGKSPLVLPKITAETPTLKPKEHKDHKNHHSKSFKRQISNVRYITDRYELLKTLGDGNFAVVKQAKLKSTDNEYAIKVIDKSKMKGKEHMIDNEIYIMKSCNHPNIVKLYEEFETPDEVYLVTDLVKGGDLFDAITQSVKFNEKDAAGMVKDLCEALFYLHSKNIVHRDLKPENLLVMRRKDGSISIKLADFGLAMEVKEPIYTVCGTPTYVAPEILAETGYGLEVDMWACGVITYILLCGFPPFRSLDRNQEELFQYIQAGEFEYLMPYWEGISESSKDLINHLLVVDVKRRWKAEDVLCHPWIITHGNSKEMPSNYEETRKEILSELKAKAKQYAAEPFFKL